MGLDWLPGNKPKPGFEAEYEEIVHAIFNQKLEEDSPELARFHEISISAYETLSAPRIGYDESATAWARKWYKEEQPDQPEEEWLESLKGYYVVDLVPPCDGIPRYSNSPLGYVEAFSFRAEFLKDCTDIIGDDMLESAYQNKVPENFLAYGEKLTEQAERYARENSIDLKELDGNKKEGEPEYQLDIVLRAGRWCIFWAVRGHLLDPDY